MAKLINIGFGNVVNSSKIVAIISPDSAPSRRMVQNAKDQGTVIDATKGRKTKGIIVTDGGMIILSALMPETRANRFYSRDSVEENE